MTSTVPRGTSGSLKVCGGRIRCDGCIREVDKVFVYSRWWTVGLLFLVNTHTGPLRDIITPPPRKRHKRGPGDSFPVDRQKKKPKGASEVLICSSDSESNSGDSADSDDEEEEEEEDIYADDYEDIHLRGNGGAAVEGERIDRSQRGRPRRSAGVGDGTQWVDPRLGALMESINQDQELMNMRVEEDEEDQDDDGDDDDGDDGGGEAGATKDDSGDGTGNGTKTVRLKFVTERLKGGVLIVVPANQPLRASNLRILKGVIEDEMASNEYVIQSMTIDGDDVSGSSPTEEDLEDGDQIDVAVRLRKAL